MGFSFLKKFSSPATDKEKRKKYRYHVPSTLASLLEIEIPSGERLSLEIRDLNDEAVSGTYSPVQQVPVPAITFFGARLKINGFEFHFRGELVRYGLGILVLKYTQYDPQKHRHLIGLFPRWIGGAMVQKETRRLGTSWMHGPNDTDFFFQTGPKDSSQILSATLVSENLYFYWNPEEGARTGWIVRETFNNGFSFSKRQPNPILYDRTPDRIKARWLMCILESADLPEESKKTLIAILEKISK